MVLLSLVLSLAVAAPAPGDELFIIRLNDNGSVDTTWDGNGIAVGHLGSNRDVRSNELISTLDENGLFHVWAGGQIEVAKAPYVVRLNTSGSQEETQFYNFAGSIFGPVNPGGGIKGIALATTPDRALFSAIEMQSSSGARQVGIAKLIPSTSDPDPTWGSGSSLTDRVLTIVTSPNPLVSSVPEDIIINQFNAEEIGVCSRVSDGSPTPSFLPSFLLTRVSQFQGLLSNQLVATPANTDLQSVAKCFVNTSQKYIIAGQGTFGASRRLFFARFNSSGTPDAGFGLNGFASINVTTAGNESLVDAADAGDGGIFFVGIHGTQAMYGKVSNSLTLPSSWGTTSGVSVYSLPGSTENVYEAIGPSGFAAGYSRSGDNMTVIVSQYLASTGLPNAAWQGDGHAQYDLPGFSFPLQVTDMVLASVPVPGAGNRIVRYVVGWGECLDPAACDQISKRP